MLTDSYKPLRGNGPVRIARPASPNIIVDLGRKKAAQNQGERLATARDRTSAYALSRDPSLSEQEKGQMRNLLKERFTPGARPMPATIQGLASLADRRITDAIAQGKFRNIPRGKGKNTERDHMANSPFLDTTEYFMNKIIQKQAIVPPWIEKQQELVKAAAVFRSRLRADWKRHVVRVIASKGGTLEEQVRLARGYVAAEAALTSKVASPSETNDEKTKSIDGETLGNISESPAHTIATTNEDPFPSSPFRDRSWEILERAYHNLAIAALNKLVRDYNLQAPTLAKKPYYSLSRELASCFADVAPMVITELLTRASSGSNLQGGDAKIGGQPLRWAGQKVRVVDSTKAHYGFRQFWNEVWGREAKP